MKRCILLFVLLVCVFSLSVPAFANSAEPPAIIILSNDLPEDAVLTLETANADVIEFREIRSSVRAWEKQFRIWLPWDLSDPEVLVLRVTVGEESFTCEMPEHIGKAYRSVMTLDYGAQTLKMGQEPWRIPLLTAIRVLLTLLTEAAVFYLFGFREKRTWFLFLAVNLLTQGWLNSIINSNSFASGYWLMTYYFAEIVIFLGETLVFCFLSKEQKRWKRIVCPLAANAASLALGILLISNLPL